MNSELKPELQNLFDSANLSASSADQTAEAFTAGVMSKTRSLKFRVIAGLLGFIAVLLLAAWLMGIPVQNFAQLMAHGLSANIINLGDGWLAWGLAPVNNIGGLLLLVWKGLRMMRKRLSGTSYFG